MDEIVEMIARIIRDGKIAKQQSPEIARAALLALHAGGWRVVPESPTVLMLRILGCEADLGDLIQSDEMKKYRAMLDASPVKKG